MREVEVVQPVDVSDIGEVRGVLRTEALFVLIASLYWYSQLGIGWKVFFIFFLLPDLSMLGYLVTPRIGAMLYNMAHSYVGAFACFVLSVILTSEPLLVAGLIWTAHIGMDRAFGYGLKFSRGFNYTHLSSQGVLPHMKWSMKNP